MSRGIKVLSLTVLLAVIGAGAALVAACGSSTSSTSTSSSAAPSTSPTATKMYKVGITQIVTHPALDATVKGFKEALAAKGFVEGQNVTFDFQNAEGDISTAATIAQKFGSEGLDLIFSVATPTSQAVVKVTSTVPIVFCAVTDPVGAGLVKDLTAPEANVTGVSDMQPVAPILQLVKLVPNAKAIGAIYNAGEANSVFLIKAERVEAAKLGYKLIEATASTSSEVQAAAQSLVGRVQAITTIGDNTVASALEAVVKICEQNKILLLAGDTDSVQRGAAAGFGFNYEDLGKQAGDQAAKILSGTAVKDVPVEFAKNLLLAINQKAAKAMGITLPAALISQAALKY
jgi:putative tryptophan/tyrosine transport system substrate-binding protein